MRRSFALLAFFLILSNTAQSQVLIALVFGDKLNSEKLEFGLNAGLESADITTIEASRYRALTLGLFFNVKLNEKFSLHPEVNALAPGGADGLATYPIGNADIDSAFQDGTVTRILSYASLPVLVKYSPWPWLGIEVGPYGSLLFSAKDLFETEVDDPNLVSNLEDVSFNNVITDQYKRLDFGVAAGLTYRLRQGKGVGINFRYTRGLVDILKDNTGAAQMNNAFIVKAEIPIKGAKKEDAEN